MEIIAFLIIAAASLWLVAVGGLMAFRPRRFLHYLAQTASTRRINNIEQGLRLLVGSALVVQSGSSKLPMLFAISGWFIIISSVILLVIPLRWHAGYAIWWAERMRPWMVRAIAPASAVFGVGLFYLAQ